MGDQWKEVLDLIDQKKAKRTSDTLKANRTYQEELIKSSPEYKETQKTERKAKSFKAKTDLRKAKEEASPQSDILRFGDKVKKYRDLGYKERVITKENEAGDDETKIQYIPRPGNQIYEGQMNAYADSVKLANIANEYNTTTPTVRKIDKQRKQITKEYEDAVREYAKGTPEFSEASPKISIRIARKRAGSDLVKKYGEAILPLLNDLANR